MLGNFRINDSSRGSTLVELSMCLSIITLLVFGGIDLLTTYRYSSVAYSVAVLSARFGSVEHPNAAPPEMDLLKIPVNVGGYPEYLTKWRDSLFSAGGELDGVAAPYPGFDAAMLSALNLGLGWAKELLPKIKTVSTWGSAADVRARLPDPGEMYLLPRHYIWFKYPVEYSAYLDANGLDDDVVAHPSVEFLCCVRVPLLLLPDPLVCRKSRASYYEI